MEGRMMTGIPIDYRNVPFKDKYLTEETFLLNHWFIFGSYPDGTVNISDSTDDIIQYVPWDVAERIIEARKVFCNTIERELGYNIFGGVNDEES
jgi:hypothetical protein